MDDVARFSDRDRQDLFRASAEKRGISPVIIEKDFWVCWTLKRVFALEHPPASILFKGGTSLAKVFRVIERFSEDIDLVFDRAGLGYTGERDPASARSRKSRDALIEELRADCQRAVRERLLPQLQDSFKDALGKPPTAGWSIELADDDADDQTIVFRYPSQHRGEQAGYIRPEVRLEIGARGDHWPSEPGSVTPYAAEDMPPAFKDAIAPVHVLSVARTFWEKATILHMLYHKDPAKPLGARLSRHYYDLVRLWQSEHGTLAVKDLALLAAVAEHKSRFFPAAWARYEDARPGTLRLVLPDHRHDELRADYSAMSEMIFVEPISFGDLIEVLRELEHTVNSSA